MRNQLIVLQHHPLEGVGEIGVWADQHGIGLDVHRADLGELPQETDRPCVLLGGPYSVNAAPDWLQREWVWLRERIADDLPVLGICLGSQLLAHALGGQIHRLDRPETGWTTIRFTDRSGLDVLQWHEDAFTLPPGAQPLASSADCPQQMFRVGTHYLGIQFHPEWNAAQVNALNAYFGMQSPLPRQIDSRKHQCVAAWLHEQLSGWWEA